MMHGQEKEKVFFLESKTQETLAGVVAGPPETGAEKTISG